MGDMHGMYIEMKVGYNKPTVEQSKFLFFAQENGYCVSVCYSGEEAWEDIKNYLKIKT